jgi:glycosyltransferase involved in cell wall biosynthesis
VRSFNESKMAQMKKIGILSIENALGGGIEQYIQSLVDALSGDNSFEYIFFSNADDNRFKSSDLEVRKVSRQKLNHAQKAIRALQIILKIRRPWFFSIAENEIYADINFFISPTVSHYPHFYLNRPFLFVLHDFQERYFPQFFSLKDRVARFITTRKLANISNKILCESNHVKADIKKFLGQENDNIIVIPGPPPTDFVKFEYDINITSKISDKYRLPLKYIFYPAQFWPHKNHIKLLEAFEIVSKQQKDLFLVLTGKKQNYYRVIKSKIDELGLRSKVFYPGYIDYCDLPYLYKMSEMLIMPTLFESISIPIYEAFSLRVPVCASNVEALPEQVGDCGLIFDPNNAEDMSEKIIKLITDKNLRDQMVDKAYSKILSLNHEKYQYELVKALKKIINQ